MPSERSERTAIEENQAGPFGTAKTRVLPLARTPRKITAASLENAAHHYLERFGTSAENLRRVLMRRVERSARAHGTDPADGAALVDDLVVRFRRAGILDDRAYAEARTATLHRRGVPAYGIRLRLRAKGVADDDIDAALAGLTEAAGDAHLAAAVNLARRRRLGPYRDPATRADRRDKDLAALARAGFDLDTARRVIDAETPEDVADLSRG